MATIDMSKKCGRECNGLVCGRVAGHDVRRITESYSYGHLCCAAGPDGKPVWWDEEGPVPLDWRGYPTRDLTPDEHARVFRHADESGEYPPIARPAYRPVPSVLETPEERRARMQREDELSGPFEEEPPWINQCFPDSNG